MTTILLVDDYAPNHRLMSFVLEQSGYAVVSALDGEQALSCLDIIPVDCIVTDLAMPHLDGIALAERVRNHPRLSGVPIIMVTASGQESDAAKAAGAGVDTFLTKPVDSEDLAQAVMRLLREAAARAGAAVLSLRPSAA
jgi:two-component system chemotaxis response regulator CheY